MCAITISLCMCSVGCHVSSISSSHDWASHTTWPSDPQSSRHLHVTSSNDEHTQCHFTLLLLSLILITITCHRATRRPSIQWSRATQRPFCYSSHVITAASRIFITLSRVAVYQDLYHCRRQPYAWIYHRKPYTWIYFTLLQTAVRLDLSQVAIYLDLIHYRGSRMPNVYDPTADRFFFHFYDPTAGRRSYRRSIFHFYDPTAGRRSYRRSFLFSLLRPYRRSTILPQIVFFHFYDPTACRRSYRRSFFTFRHRSVFLWKHLFQGKSSTLFHSLAPQVPFQGCTSPMGFSRSWTIPPTNIYWHIRSNRQLISEVQPLSPT
jgi:hypothetical protein